MSINSCKTCHGSKVIEKGGWFLTCNECCKEDYKENLKSIKEYLKRNRKIYAEKNS